MSLVRLYLRLGSLLALLAIGFAATPASAASCYYATSQGATGPADWQTYCWLDFSGYVDATARSAAGQNLSYTLPDGSVLGFNIKISGIAVSGVAAPTWGGAAIGNTGFVGIGGRPVLYQTTWGTSNISITGTSITPPASGTISNFMLVAADAETTNENESLSLTTNGGNWQMLGQVGPISGSAYPTYSGIGTKTFTITGAPAWVGAYVVGSTSPTQVSTTLVGGGAQGVMFAVRFASIRLNTQISGARVQAADQFKFDIAATSTGAMLASGTSSGAGLGPFTAAALASTSSLPLTLKQAMAPGSSSAISHYQSRLTCTNEATSSTPLPSAVITTSYDFGVLQYGDAVRCTFVETPFPHLTLTKALGAGGRQFDSDQFEMRIAQGGSTVASTTTTGTGSTIANGSTPQFQASVGIAYDFNELAVGATSLTQYTSVMNCTNAASGTGTVLPTTVGGTITPQMGDVVTCVITNTRKASNATLIAGKQSLALSDPVNAGVNPRMIPGAIARYSITVQNTGPGTVDGNSIFIVDSLPSQISVGTAASPTIVQGSPPSGLTIDPSTDVGYSTAASMPTTFAQCSYVPTVAYDPAIRHVCINPKGVMVGSTGIPPSFTVTFNGQVH